MIVWSRFEAGARQEQQSALIYRKGIPDGCKIRLLVRSRPGNKIMRIVFRSAETTPKGPLSQLGFVLWCLVERVGGFYPVKCPIRRCKEKKEWSDRKVKSEE